MSTLLGHSALHALHPMHRSMTSYIALLVSAPAGRRPAIAARSALARPRVLCASSHVTMNDGHIVPPCTLRQAPTPLHSSTAAASPPSRAKSWIVGTAAVR